MAENIRFITGLKNAGWTPKEINDFIIYIGTGDEQFMPGKNNKEQRS